MLRKVFTLFLSKFSHASRVAQQKWSLKPNTILSPYLWGPVGLTAIASAFWKSSQQISYHDNNNQLQPLQMAIVGATSDPSDIPLKVKILETGADVIQSFKPLKNFHSHAVGPHFYNGDIKCQCIAHHYCGHLNKDIQQCVLFDSDAVDAKLIGVEYIISEKLFNQLPESERQLWHSHRYEVKSGLLMAPRLPDMAEKELMKEMVTTYGKTFHFWRVDRGDVLPVGGPRLMMAFTRDGQVKNDIVEKLEEQAGSSVEHKRKHRSDITEHEILPGADAWQDGNVVQVTLAYK